MQMVPSFEGRRTLAIYPMHRSSFDIKEVPQILAISLAPAKIKE